VRALNHVHILAKLNAGHRTCIDPHCRYTCPNADAKGKASRCGVCGINEVIMDNKQMKLAKPRCDACSQRKDAVERRRIESTLKGLGL
jgi:hypothetical protein